MFSTPFLNNTAHPLSPSQALVTIVSSTLTSRPRILAFVEALKPYSSWPSSTTVVSNLSSHPSSKQALVCSQQCRQCSGVSLTLTLFLSKVPHINTLLLYLSVSGLTKLRNYIEIWNCVGEWFICIRIVHRLPAPLVRQPQQQPLTTTLYVWWQCDNQRQKRYPSPERADLQQNRWSLEPLQWPG